MPVMVDKWPFGDRTFAERGSAHATRRQRAGDDRARYLDIGLINNMPDAALEGTVRQFYVLLSAAAKDVVVRLKLFSIPGVPRTEWGREHLSAFYSDIGDLWKHGIDGLIVTGTEPRAAELVDEPYWGGLTDIIDWAEDNTVATVWSCLAAQAAVLHLDGIRRSPLVDKRFGVFEHRKASTHRLLQGVSARIAAPHSRWNEIPEQSLATSNYDILTRSTEAGVDMFVKQRKSLFLCFQGHPEYETETLFREYRRDVGRFLRRESDSYPGMPCGYLNEAIEGLLNAFRARALIDRREDLLSTFPASHAVHSPRNSWQADAVRSYRNWLGYIAAHKRSRTEARRAAVIWRSGASG
jgi:homoserine O-succinyltransferase/O-acetyltransferase